MNITTLQYAKTIWDYHFLQESLSKADCILVLGSHDIRIAEYACDLFQQSFAPYIAFSGASNFFTSKIYSSTEAEAFAEVALRRGIPREKMLVENQARNTEENLRLSEALLKIQHLNFESFILVQTPNMLRRVKATALKVWPNKKFIVTSHPISFEQAPHAYLTEEMFIHEIVGDLQRILLYPERGFQVPQLVPDKVMKAYKSLLELGFTGNLI